MLLLLVWLVGLGAIIMLWRRDSSSYLAASKAGQAPGARQAR